MSMVDAELLVVFRASELPDAPASVGLIKCGGCGAECHIAKPSIDLIARKPGILVRCLSCAESMARDSISNEVRPVPGAMREIDDLLQQPNYARHRNLIKRPSMADQVAEAKRAADRNGKAGARAYANARKRGKR